MSDTRLRIGFIPLCDAAALIVAADKGFAKAEGLELELVREVSWSNVRDKLNIGLFDAAHLIAPVAIASSLGLGHVKVPIIAPFGLGVNGNAITVSPELQAAIAGAADGDIRDPTVSARALARVVANRKARGEEPLTFGMTFPSRRRTGRRHRRLRGARIRPRRYRCAPRGLENPTCLKSIHGPDHQFCSAQNCCMNASRRADRPRPARFWKPLEFS